MSRRGVLWLLLLTVAVAFVAVGAAIGGAYDVFAKAARICSECIGLG